MTIELTVAKRAHVAFWRKQSQHVPFMLEDKFMFKELRAQCTIVVIEE